jgi:exopolyphosphatase/guanosine-5'-triphosphate,3'-diphosphate pyrophosphatase
MTEISATSQDQKPAFLKPYEGHVIAFMDIGTNSLRLLLVRINPNRSYTTLSDQKEIVRLGEGEFVEQSLQPEAMRRAVLVAHKFVDMAKAYRAEEIIAVATSATREADNRDEFLRRLKRDAQLEVRVVSGREEARLIYRGVASGVNLGEKQALFIDIGGGSTEVIVGGQDQYNHLDSLKLGAIRLTSLFFLPNENEPVPPARYALIQQYVRNAAIRTVQQVSQDQVEVTFGSSGTIENLADIAILRDLKRRRQRDDVMTHSQLKQAVEMLCALPLEERRKVPAINPTRADIIIGGAAILDTLMQDLGIDEIHISDRGLRDGLLMDYLSRSEHGDMLEGIPVRTRSVLQLGRSCNFDETHARDVARLALDLFDSGREAGLHRFGSQERELLEYAALVHDVGTFLSYTNHQQHSYYLIRNADLLGFDQTEIAIMANAGLFHRKAMPRKKKHPEFAELDKQSQQIVRLYAILLRIAESLDRSHTGVVQHAFFRKREKKKICLEIQASGDCQLELWGVQNHRAAFEKVFKRKLSIQPVIDQPVDRS